MQKKEDPMAEAASPPVEGLVTSIVQALCDDTASVQILSDSNTTIFKVTLPAAHMGKLIGRNGSLVSAIRRILVGLSGRDGRSYLIEVMQANNEGIHNATTAPTKFRSKR